MAKLLLFVYLALTAMGTALALLSLPMLLRHDPKGDVLLRIATASGGLGVLLYVWAITKTK